MIRRYLIFAVSLLLCIGVGTFTQLPAVMAGNTLPAPGDDRPSDLKFSHRYHIVEAGVDCATCHPAAATSKLSSDNLASTHDQCSTCHADQVSGECGYCHKNPENIVARPVAERIVIFSHENHLGKKDVECTTCHKGLEGAELASATNLPDMKTCNTCHNDQKASNLCETCHTDFVTLLPADHKQSDFLRTHRDVARLGALQTSCQTCHTESFCLQCHQGAGLKAFLPQDLSVEPRPKTSTKDSPKRMILQNIHALDYRFTHGIDARAKQSDCTSCHSMETFCVKCHEAGGNISQGTFKPQSHSAPGFGVGGLHAEEARRDMESCMSCHDVEGRDPTCLTCHEPSGSVR